MIPKLRFSPLLTSAVMLFGSMAVPVSADSCSNDIVILYTNDVHCGVDTNIGYDGLMLYKREMQAEYGDNVFTVDAGDAIQGMPIGTLSDGEYITRIMNAVGYDAAVLGNHEFDYGFDELKKRSGGDRDLCKMLQDAIDSAQAEGADYVILLAHLGENNVFEGQGAPDVVSQLSGVSAVIGGHSHEVTPSVTVKDKDGKNVVKAFNSLTAAL